MNKLFEAMNLKNLKIKNRICVPPMVCYNWVEEDGYVVQRNIDHYRAIARGGAGLIIQEATCVDPEGKLSKDQLGIWEDGQIAPVSTCFVRVIMRWIKTEKKESVMK